MEKSAIFNLYIRKQQIEASVEQVIVEINRNEKIIEILNRASDEEKESTELKKFTDTIQQQVDSYYTQKDKMNGMIENTDKVIKLYESDKEKYEDVINSLLLSFGFEETEKPTNNNQSINSTTFEQHIHVCVTSHYAYEMQLQFKQKNDNKVCRCEFCQLPLNLLINSTHKNPCLFKG